ncbi:ATP-dependent DNA helicase Q-like 4A [Leucoagaricus sp. SymC.cos]|nr:ATP-dependent DNA helicase Q-like 4A [Leucoagaricus sp. SymC.cos]
MAPPVQSAATGHEAVRLRSCENLESTRRVSYTHTGYDSTLWRTQLITATKARLGFTPHDWQVNVAEALMLGLDVVVIAGTGCGKTAPFMMSVLLNPGARLLIISPLKALQEDQECQFLTVGLSVVAVNGDTWGPSLRERLRRNPPQVILASPEMCIKHTEFRRYLTETNFEKLAGIAIDECHCISQWGGDFRPTYGELSKLRTFLPPHIPILATTATLPPAALRDMRVSLGIDAVSSYFINLGNDRLNITYSVESISSSEDYSSLKSFITRDNFVNGGSDFIKTIIFVNSVVSTQLAAREIRQWLPFEFRAQIGYLSARRSARARRRVMEKFRGGQFKILVATEAAGMGADIEQVIQLGVPSSIDQSAADGGDGHCPVWTGTSDTAASGYPTCTDY